MHEVPCEHCKNVLPYDGREDCVFNTTGRYMYSYEVMNQAEGDFIRRSLPIQLAYQALRERIRSQWYVSFLLVALCTYFDIFASPSPSCDITPSIKSFRYALYHYIGLMRVDYPALFQCSICGPHPSVVVCDGVALSFQAAQLVERAFQRPSDVTVTRTNKSFCKQRRLYLDRLPEPRKLLGKLVDSGLSSAEYDALTAACKPKQVELVRLLTALRPRWIQPSGVVSIPRSDGGLRRFLDSLAKVSCMSAFVPYYAKEFIRRAIDELKSQPSAERLDATLYGLLQKFAPLVAEVFSSMSDIMFVLCSYSCLCLYFCKQIV